MIYITRINYNFIDRLVSRGRVFGAMGAAAVVRDERGVAAGAARAAYEGKQGNNGLVVTMRTGRCSIVTTRLAEAVARRMAGCHAWFAGLAGSLTLVLGINRTWCR